ncbi:hypothetical protein [Phenylobacterium sp.]|uniref:hypothetical protein n=1 Tax=Phenylobacterium sp. TaxID=1871053 RepID=UPI00286D5E29|nr:hypothetical protein [Phenylobacterium sp.]
MSKSVAKRIAHDLDDALDDIGRELKKAGEAISEEARDNFTRVSTKLQHTAHDFAVEARRQSRDLTDQAVTQARQHPATAVAIATAAIALIGLAFWRSQPSD